MKKFLLGTAALIAIGIAAPASAADLATRPYKAAPVAVPMMYDWSGFYIGANGGYGWSRQCVDVTAVNAVAFAFAEGCRDAGGGIAGGQIGYRWQAGTWVFGLEAQGDWANLRSERVSLFNPANTWKTNINGLGLFTGQVGYAWDATLLYVKGGAAVVNHRVDIFDTATGIGTQQAERTRWGGVIGVGLEYGFAPNWTAGIEYDYLFRTSEGNTYLTPALAPVITSIAANTRTDVSMVTGRISYKFGGYGAPIAARY
jgi:outer membrane immunogenic protein